MMILIGTPGDSFCRPDPLTATAVVGRVWRGTPDEAGDFEPALCAHPLVEAGVCAISPAHPSFD